MKLNQRTLQASLLGTVAVIGLCVATAAQAQQQQTSSAMDAALAKKIHPTWVQIPGQLIRPDCVHELPKGSRVEVVDDKITGDVTLAGRVIAHYEACSEPAISTRQRASSPGFGVTAPGTGNGWVEAVETDMPLSASDNIDWLSGTWIVPAAPTATGGLVYLFNGIEPTTQNWILQPVLQFGNNGYFGGNYWVIASWMVGPNNYAFYSPAEKVNPGDTIYGTTYLTSQANGKLNWEVFAQDDTSGVYTWITANTTGLHWTWGYSAVLEAYNISSCSQLPSSDPNIFSNGTADHGYPSYIASPSSFGGWVSSSWAGPQCGFTAFPYGTSSYLYYY
jgi:hypothetical protein